MTKGMEDEVINFTTCHMCNEFDDDVKSVFITHGQDLQVHLHGEYHRDEINEVGEGLVQRLKDVFGYRFTHRQTGPKMLGLIIDEDQTR
jgi:hypothetical protein